MRSGLPDCDPVSSYAGRGGYCPGGSASRSNRARCRGSGGSELHAQPRLPGLLLLLLLLLDSHQRPKSRAQGGPTARHDGCLHRFERLLLRGPQLQRSLQVFINGRVEPSEGQYACGNKFPVFCGKRLAVREGSAIELVVGLQEIDILGRRICQRGGQIAPFFPHCIEVVTYPLVLFFVRHIKLLYFDAWRLSTIIAERADGPPTCICSWNSSRRISGMPLRPSRRNIAARCERHGR